MVIDDGLRETCVILFKFFLEYFFFSKKDLNFGSVSEKKNREIVRFKSSLIY